MNARLKVLAALAVILAAVATGQASAPTVQAQATGKIKLSLETSVYVEAPHKKALDGLKAAYEKLNPNIEIEYRGADYANFWDKMTVEIVGNTEADIVQLQSDASRYATYAALRTGETGAFVNLDKYIKGTHWEDDLVSQKMMTYNGHYIGISNYAWGVQGFFYRKSLVKDGGVDPTAIKTIDDLQAALIKLTKKGEGGKPDQYGLAATLSTHPFVVNEWYSIMARQMGNGIFFPEEKAPYTPDALMVNSQPIIDAAQIWQDWMVKYKVSAVGQDKAAARDLFWAGRAAFNWDGPWFTGMTREKDAKLLDDMDIIATPPIMFKGTLRWQYANTNAITHLISSNSKHPDEAWKFLEWMASPEAQKIVNLSGMIPSNKQYSGSADYIAGEPVNAKIVKFLEQYQPAMPSPNIPQYGELDKIFQEAGQAMYIKGEPVKDTLDKAAADMKKVLSK